MRTDLGAVKQGARLKARKTAADEVADSLREAIQSGSLADGAVLSQAAIAEHFQVSRVPVREAMRQLLAEGLIELQAHQVAVVRAFSPERIGEIYEHRALLEGYITERAVPLVTAADVATLRAKNERMAAITNHAKWLEVNLELHDLILRIGGDETGLELVHWLRSRAARYVSLWGGDGAVRRPQEVGSEHEEIIALIERGQPAPAREAVEAHIKRTGRLLVAHGRAKAEAGDEVPAGQ